ncbi:hypothetical protein N7475_008600 [Penicillium sp. IBT 31633x]|nr:hypothetical protein N7475_008600 [Penicillium sp. IBT 31633x]
MAPDASLNHNAACTKRHPDTGLWLFNSYQFTGWLIGCGMSVLSSTAIQHTFHKIKHRQDVEIAFFYFPFANEAKQDVNDMLRTLLLQLSSSGTPIVEVLLNLLHQFGQRFCDIFILFDALDESPLGNKRQDVLKGDRYRTQLVLA